MATIHEVVQQIADGKSPIYMDGIWNAQSFQEGDGGITADALTTLGLEDVTSDPRWFRSFEFDGQRLGLYRDSDGYYWCAWYVEVDRAVELCFVGTMSDVIDEFSYPDDDE